MLTGALHISYFATPYNVFSDGTNVEGCKQQYSTVLLSVQPVTMHLIASIVTKLTRAASMDCHVIPLHTVKE